MRGKNVGCVGFKFIILFYNRPLVWIEFKFALEIFDNRLLGWIEFKFVLNYC